MCSPNPSFLREAWSWEFPSCCMVLCQGWGLCQECVSAFPTHFDVGIFSFTWYGSHSASFWTFSEGNAPSVAIHWVYPREEGSPGPPDHHLGPSSAFLLFNFFQKELEKQKRIKRNQQLEAAAKEHYERVLLRKKGLEPWKRLRMQSKQNIQV